MSAQGNDDLKMIYLDKNYPPAEIKKSLEAINEVAQSLNAKIKRVALVPKMEPANLARDYPLSLNLLLQCYIRCLEREGHITMSNEDPERLMKILVLFFQQFKGTRFDENFA